MALTHGAPVIDTLLTDADLTGKEWFIVKQTGGRIALSSAGTDQHYGILTDTVADGSVTDAEVAVQVGGSARVSAGGIIGAGAYFTSDANGEAVAAASGDIAVGRVKQAAADGDIVACEIDITAIP